MSKRQDKNLKLWIMLKLKIPNWVEIEDKTMDKLGGSYEN